MSNVYYKQALENEMSVNNIMELLFISVVHEWYEFYGSYQQWKKFAYPITEFLWEIILHFFYQGFCGKKQQIRSSDLHFYNKILNTNAVALYWLVSCYKSQPWR